MGTKEERVEAWVVGFLSPLPGLAVHWETEPSAHALGYHLSALRAWCRGDGGHRPG